MTHLSVFVFASYLLYSYCHIASDISTFLKKIGEIPENEERVDFAEAQIWDLGSEDAQSRGVE